MKILIMLISVFLTFCTMEKPKIEEAPTKATIYKLYDFTEVRKITSTINKLFHYAVAVKNTYKSPVTIEIKVKCYDADGTYRGYAMSHDVEHFYYTFPPVAGGNIIHDFECMHPNGYLGYAEAELIIIN